MKSSEIRDKFLKFFQEKGHLVLPSSSLVPQNDPTLLLIGAGMAPLKPYFTGEKTPPHPRVATCQKCVRTPDIDKVGITARHATFFEMLGNFSFGDYFKEEAISWAWELVTQGYNIPEERLYVSIYENDDEAFAIWRDKIGLPESRIYRLGKDDNFWEIGQGPCGPCSEIYYDLGPEYGCGRPDCEVGCDCDRFLEVWNLVFTQFNKEADGSYKPLEQKNIDTGAGLERLALVLQGVSNLFEIDTVRPVLEHFASKAGVTYGRDCKKDISLRVLTEHLRGVAFMVADGIMPSNEGRGYVLRRILRRAVRHGKLLELEAPFLSEAVLLLVELMGDAYPELRKNSDYIMRVIRLEEERFKETLEQGMDILENHIAALQAGGKAVLPGEVAFKLYDTYGFPLDLTREILGESGLSVDEKAFDSSLEQQRERARGAALGTQEAGQKNVLLSFLVKGMVTQFVGYDTLSAEGEVIGIVAAGRGELLAEADLQTGEEELYLILDQSPFYSEKGGQVGDTGLITAPEGVVLVKNTLPGPGEQILHLVEIKEGRIRTGERVRALVEQKRRQDIARHHTSTHLLHRALRDLLGEHVHQAGSLVSPERLRFDFSHFTQLQAQEIARLEETVNDLLQKNLPVQTSYVKLDQALEMGAMALFDEKYGEKVRLVQIDDYSLELCGGTHVGSTGEIGVFKILSEGGVGAGMRRIEALAGDSAYRYFVHRDEILKEVSMLVKAPVEKVSEKLQEILESQKELQRRIKQLSQKLSRHQLEGILEQVDHSLGVPVLSTRVEAESMETLREYLDKLRDKLGSGIIMLGSVTNGKVFLAAAVTQDLVKKGFHAGRLIGEAARITGGGGGGRADMAQAGGKDPQKLQQALASVLSLVQEQQKQ
ncbi:MAG: alanine--tRNA ligase [Dethiobacter sp.]|jgi:alanyl-tRNA synthetase|nr:MAG: alanine--tRNA ligase [Dethiobacter sp.]